MASHRSFAVIPAAGRSVRMGQAKLLLPYQGATIIDHVLRCWVDCVDRAVVVVRSDDIELSNRCSLYDVDLVRPDKPPPDMKASVIHGLRHIQSTYAPSSEACWLLAPADTPRIGAHDIQAVLTAFTENSSQAVVASHDGLRGHPLLMPWSFAERVERLGENEGIRDLLANTAYRCVECSQPGVLEDLDTPSDYDRLRGDS